MKVSKLGRTMRNCGVAALALVASVVTVAVAGPADAGNHEKLSFKMSGSQVPGGGDPDGKGKALLRLYPDKEVVCYRVNWSNLDGEVTGMHMHAAPAGQVGDHHIDLFNDEHLRGKWNRIEACVQVESYDPAHSPMALIEEVIENPEGFYLNVHSTAFPPGAIRGQLDD